jgi:hypothetical protein
VNVVPTIKFLLSKFFEIVSRNQLPKCPEEFRPRDGFERIVDATDFELDTNYKGGI